MQVVEDAIIRFEEALRYQDVEAICSASIISAMDIEG
jgi:hypothetical protein